MAEDGEVGAGREKLVARKQEWAREGRLLTGTTADPARVRLPPGQRLVRDWPVLDLGVQPDVTVQTFRLDLDGAGRPAARLDAGRVPGAAAGDSDGATSTASRRGRATTTAGSGVAARTLLDLAMPKPEARHVIFHAHDGYTTNVPLDRVRPAGRAAGASLERRADPARARRPGARRDPAALFLEEREVGDAHRDRAEDRPGFWEVRGYHNDGDPWTEERYG